MKFHDGRAGAAILVRVIPNAKANQFLGVMPDGRVKIKVVAPAVEGAANRAVVKLLASLFGVKERDVEIVGGATGRDKLVTVVGLSAEVVQQRLAEAGTRERKKRR